MFCNLQNTEEEYCCTEKVLFSGFEMNGHTKGFRSQNKVRITDKYASSSGDCKRMCPLQAAEDLPVFKQTDMCLQISVRKSNRKKNKIASAQQETTALLV